MVSPSFVMTTVLAGLVYASSTEAMRILSPSEGMEVMGNTPFEVEWTDTDEGMLFNIDLYFCGVYSLFCSDYEHGDHVASLCPEGDAGCAAKDGGYEVVMPEPIMPGDGYRVCISQVGGDNMRCSDSFNLMSDSEHMGIQASITMLSPTSELVALSGEDYTVEFKYDNGLGSSAGRFMIDLYESVGSGDCGSWVTSICDRPDKGCKDWEGDYNIAIPAAIASGNYRIRVGLFGDESVYACSETFNVVSQVSGVKG